MATKRAKVTFTTKPGQPPITVERDITINPDGSVLIPVPQGRIVPGTDVAIVIDGKTFKSKGTIQPGSTQMTLPPGSIPGVAVS
jgi:hypothetical protein